MTHSGGKPHNVGDHGQRYMVTYAKSDDPDAMPDGDAPSSERKVFGWSDTLDGAEAFCRSIELHPAMFWPWVHDRSTDPPTVIVP